MKTAATLRTLIAAGTHIQADSLDLETTPADGTRPEILAHLTDRRIDELPDTYLDLPIETIRTDRKGGIHIQLDAGPNNENNQPHNTRSTQP